jgi:hypothetical protein
MAKLGKPKQASRRQHLVTQQAGTTFEGSQGLWHALLRSVCRNQLKPSRLCDPLKPDAASQTPHILFRILEVIAIFPKSDECLHCRSPLLEIANVALARSRSHEFRDRSPRAFRALMKRFP